ncbi:MAG: hypothetical protein PHR62_09905 [Paludibacter sp.]|nr:hypothetical protein [Paludibacter sp.]
MLDINWKQLEKNSESKEIGFELFCFQIAYRKYNSIGHFDSWYNTPGSEFYLTLEKDSDELGLKTGDVIGWQAKFWLSNKEEDNSPLDTNNRNKLLDGLSTSLRYKSNLKKWIICTPGKFSNTAPSRSVDTLESDVKKLNDDVRIEYWHKDIFLAFALEDSDFFSKLFNHYFSTKFIGFDFIKNFSEKRLERLKDKFDIDLYIENEIDKQLSYILDADKVEKRITVILKNAKRLIEYEYPFRNNEITQYHYLNDDYFDKVKWLIETRCQLVEDIYNSISVNGFSHTLIVDLIKAHGHEAETIIIALNKHLKSNTHISKPVENQDYYYENHLHESCLRFINELSFFLNGNEENEIDNVKYYLQLYSQKYIHVFGSAGYGKTNLACSVCMKCLNNKIPALLILGSNIKEHSSPQDQILASLDLKNDYSFSELLFALNELGRLKEQKIPIIIDGLNESVPTASIWKEALADIIYDIKAHDNLLLITTLREGYVQQVFGKYSYLDVENQYKIEGFSNYSLKNAVSKYFVKYNITTKGQYNGSLFKNPLLLKMFCEANRDSSNAIVNQNGIYKSIDSYISNLILKIADGDHIRKSNVTQSIISISKELWENNARAISYPDKYVSLIKGNHEPFVGSIAHSMMDEGMFFIRNLIDDIEEIQFSYDMVGGFCIAKYWLLKGKEESEIISLMQSEELQKFILSDISHPLAEDILKAMLYLIPSRCGNKAIYKLLPKLPSELYISNLDVVLQYVNDQNEFINFFASLKFDDNNISELCERVFTRIVEENDYTNTAILYHCYFNWSSFQRDIYWNERIRSNVWKILELLRNISKEPYLKNLSDIELQNHFIFCLLLFSSTDNEIRNLATKVAVIISERNPYQVIEILKKSTKLSDVYILERHLAVLCGVILRIKDRNFTNECCEYLQNEFLPNTTTNHVIILDYIDTIFEFGKYHFDYPYSIDILFRNKNELWNRDSEYEKTMLVDRKYFDMGVDVFDYDFVKSQIKGIIYDENNELGYIDIFSMLHCRINSYGYSTDLYKDIEHKLSEEQRYRREDNMDSRENYLFKYLWTSYYEFIGYLIMNNLIEKENQSMFRINDIMIDPTFPQHPQKFQLVNDCFLPAYNENLQGWINSDRNDYFENIYCTSLIDEGVEEWVLLKAYSTQKDDNKYYNQISISIDTFTFSNPETWKEFENNDFWLHPNAGEFYNLYSGELPWKEDSTKDSSDSEFVMLTNEYSFQSWNHHMRTNLCESFPFLDNRIALYLKLGFNSADLSYYSAEEKVTKFITANGSQFYLIKKTYLTKYLSENNLKLVHHKLITKYGDLGKHGNERELNPSYKDIQINKQFLI